jgi:hypothetical protein
MAGGPSFYNTNRAPEAAEAAALNVTLDSSQREQVNETRRKNNGKKGVKEFNSMTMKFISFLVRSFHANSNLFGGNPLDSLIKDIDPYTHVDDTESLLWEEPKNRPKTYRNKDIVWEKLDPKLPQLFITDAAQKYHWVKDKRTGTKEIKRNRNNEKMQIGFDKHRKFLQGLEYCCNLSKSRMPAGYHREMGTFKKALKHEKKEAKSQGEIEEKDSDPISFELFTFMCTCAVNAGDTLLWAMGLLQWHCMARCQNIDDLMFRNF